MFSTGVQEYSTGSYAQHPGPNVRWEGPRLTYWVPMYIARALWKVGRSQSNVLSSYGYIQGPMSGEKVLEYGTWVLYIYHEPYVR